MPASAEDSTPRRPPVEHSPPGAVRTHPHPGPPASSPLTAPDDSPAAPPPAATEPAAAETAPEPDREPDTESHRHEHHVLIEPEEDRWAWRRRIRQNPRQLAVYRVAVALAGLLMIALGGLTGPLPGPGGIPLVLLGLAIWASEFEWAHKVMLWFKAQLHRYRGWPARYQLLFWVLFFLVCSTLGYTYLLVMGVPFWAPTFVTELLQRLPGV